MSDYKIVYSDDPAFKNRCKKCDEHPCQCQKNLTIIPKDTSIKLRIEKNSRAGKTVTVLMDFPYNEPYFTDLTKKIKNHCGTGGTFKEGRIEIQGDHLEKIKSFLQKLGFKTKG